MKSILKYATFAALVGTGFACLASQSVNVLIKNQTGNPIRISCDADNNTHCTTTSQSHLKVVTVSDDSRGKLIAENGERLISLSADHGQPMATINVRQPGKHNHYPIGCAFDMSNSAITNVDNRALNCVETTTENKKVRTITVQ